MATIGVRYFASLRDAAGRSFEKVETDAQTLAELYEELQSQYRFPLSLADVKAAVNGEWRGLSDKVCPGDEVVFIPPVAGG